MRIGIDLGGTKIELVALSTAGEIVFQRRVDTPKDDYNAVIDAISQLKDGVDIGVYDIGDSIKYAHNSSF